LTGCAVPSDTAKGELWRWFGAIRSLAEERKPYQLSLRLVAGPSKSNEDQKNLGTYQAGNPACGRQFGPELGATPKKWFVCNKLFSSKMILV
jgi:hypothetical protein